MSDPQVPSDSPTPLVEATCPECHLDLTASKIVERVRPQEKHRDGGYVFYCPECGRFFVRDADGSTRPQD